MEKVPLVIIKICYKKKIYIQIICFTFFFCKKRELMLFTQNMTFSCIPIFIITMNF